MCMASKHINYEMHYYRYCQQMVRPTWVVSVNSGEDWQESTSPMPTTLEFNVCSYYIAI